jgi:hypothetical protein
MNSVNMHEHSRILLSDTKESTLKLEHKATTSTTRDELEASPELSRKLCYSPDSMESIPKIQVCPVQHESLQMLKPRPLDNDCERFI